MSILFAVDVVGCRPTPPEAVRVFGSAKVPGTMEIDDPVAGRTVNFGFDVGSQPRLRPRELRLIAA
jgi:hypothetical protein